MQDLNDTDDIDIDSLNLVLSDLQKQVEQSRSEIYLTINTNNKTVEEKGKMLLDSFLEGKSFDLQSFALQPVKEALLLSSLNTKDSEIICCCLLLVQNSMTRQAFFQLIDQNSNLKDAYQSFFRDSFYIHFKAYNPSNQTKQKNIDELKKLLPKANSSKSLMQYVIQDEISRLEGTDKNAGIEEVDLKWNMLRNKLVIDKNFNKLPNDFFSSKKSFFSPKWTKMIDPFQGAIMAHSWGCQKGHDIIKQFTNLDITPHEREELQKRGIL